MSKRRPSVWMEEELSHDKENSSAKRPRQNEPTHANSSTEDDSNGSPFDSDKNIQPQKILVRRQSNRILERNRQQQQQQQHQETNANDVDEIMRCETFEYVVVDDRSNVNDRTDDIVPVTRPVKRNYEFKPRSQLTTEIMKYFPDSKSSPLDNGTLTAVCTLCGLPRNYVQGNISNLKTHLKRVNDFINLIQIISIVFFNWKPKNFVLSQSILLSIIPRNMIVS